MDIKIQCQCGARFAFEVEPLDGRMPCEIGCPECGVDQTEAANQIIAKNSPPGLVVRIPDAGVPQKPAGPMRVAPRAPVPPATSVGTPATPQPGASPGGLKLNRPHETPAPPVQNPGDSPASATGPAKEVEFCSRHLRHPVESKCFICGKAICRECMKVFGFLCSAACRHQAEQTKVRVPVCEFQSSIAESRQWRKVGVIAAAVAVVIAGLVGFWAWFAFVGSHPKLYYSAKVKDDYGLAHARFLGPDQILMVSARGAVLREMETKRELWNKTFARESDFGYAEPKLHVTRDHIWVGLSKSVLRMDRKSGEILSTIALPGILTALNGDDTVLLATTREGPGKAAVTRIDLASAAARTEQIELSPVKRVKAQNELAAGAAPTQGALLSQEFGEGIAFDQSQDNVLASPGGTAQFTVKLVEQRLVDVQSIKPKSSTLINDKLTAGTSSGSVAEEVFNDIKKSRNGGFKKVDESRYAVTIRRAGGDAGEWRGEVTGPPGFFQQKTVDVLTAGKAVFLFNKQGKKLMEGKLAYPVAEELVGRHGEGSPCMEAEGTLYFFDKGTLIAYEIPAGREKWRLDTVGVASVQSDGKGNLYVCTTTASPEDIQYSDQIKLNNKTYPALLKVAASSGKVLWTVEKTGQSCFLVGKYLYACNHWTGGGPGLVVGLRDALGSGGGSGANFILSRLDPGNGRELWDYNRSEAPNEIDFNNNKIMLVYDERVDVLKFMAF